MRRRVLWALSIGFGGGLFLLLSTAWFQIQAVRQGYRAQALRRDIDAWEQREQIVDRRLRDMLSLSRLDTLAKTNFHLQIPEPNQVILVEES